MLSNYLDEQKRIKLLPKKAVKRLEVLKYLASKFEIDKIYSESQVNIVLNENSTLEDPALLRRELFEAGLINRKKDCTEYWLI